MTARLRFLCSIVGLAGLGLSIWAIGTSSRPERRTPAPLMRLVELAQHQQGALPVRSSESPLARESPTASESPSAISTQPFQELKRSLEAGKPDLFAAQGTLSALLPSIDSRDGSYVLQQALLELLSSDEGAARVAALIREADADSLLKLVRLLIWRCQSSDCLGTSTDSDVFVSIPAIVQAAVLAAIAEVDSPRAHAALQFYFPVPIGGLPARDTIMAAAKSAIQNARETTDSTTFFALDLVSRPENCPPPDLLGLFLDLAADQGSELGRRALAMSGRLDPLVAGHLWLKGLGSGDEGTLRATLQALCARYSPPGHYTAPDTFDAVLAARLQETLLTEEAIPLSSYNSQLLIRVIAGCPSPELQYSLVSDWQRSCQGPDEAAFLAEVAKSVANGTLPPDLKVYALTKSPWRPRETQE